MIITQNMLPKNLRQGSLGDLSSQMWLLTSSGSVLVMVISQGETTRASFFFFFFSGVAIEQYFQLSTVQGGS